ncbi:MAG: dihydrofolate reductase [Candidatus Azotimanducaceae bacterium]
MSNRTSPDHRIDGLAIIYARSLNHCIGIDGGLPWSLPDEYAHFNATTVGCPVIMGRRSFEDHEGALPDRLNIVLSQDRQYRVFDESVSDDILLASSLAQAIQLAAAAHSIYFVIGGAGLISEALPFANTVFETVVDAQIEGDTFLAPMDFSEWSTKLIDVHSVDSQHQFKFQVYRHSR